MFKFKLHGKNQLNPVGRIQVIPISILLLRFIQTVFVCVVFCFCFVFSSFFGFPLRLYALYLHFWTYLPIGQEVFFALVLRIYFQLYTIHWYILTMIIHLLPPLPSLPHSDCTKSDSTDLFDKSDLTCYLGQIIFTPHNSIKCAEKGN